MGPQAGTAKALKGHIVAPLRAIQLDPRDNVLVALADLPEGEEVLHSGVKYALREPIPAKHKFAIQDFPVGAEVVMYGVIVGRAHKPIARGGLTRQIFIPKPPTLRGPLPTYLAGRAEHSSVIRARTARSAHATIGW